MKHEGSKRRRNGKKCCGGHNNITTYKREQKQPKSKITKILKNTEFSLFQKVNIKDKQKKKKNYLAKLKRNLIGCVKLMKKEEMFNGAKKNM